MHALPFRARRSRPATRRGLAALVAAAVLVSGCSAADDALSSAGVGDDTDEETTAPPAAKPVIKTSVKKGATNVPVDTELQVDAKDASLKKVTVTYGDGTLDGTLADNGTRWTAADRLEPGMTYTVKSVGRSADGETVRTTSSFTTEALTLDQQTYPSVAPLDGETVGVGMPVVVTFDIPVTNKAAFERHMHVTTNPGQPGTWHWVSDTEVHYRPKKYWQAGTDVTVDIDVNGVDAGGGIYGQEDRRLTFSIGDAHVYKVNAQTHQMDVYSNGTLLRTIPITTGEQPAFTTRSGVKVIMEKFESKRMNSETVGITGSEAYDIDNVQWAMRVTNSGEFIHAAPWSVGSQGSANVSHGCTGMSTEDAAWLYAMTLRGDVVEYTGTDRPMEPDNGYGDWNIAWSDYKASSAL
ncbi:L,D-transpeptidase [Nocardioides bizhenqiangii]|uniref:Ig-like domain-containing protein n=1 Tax=Nocardioides bizhenqiangii TaxID=3095076 RepID=A0ABZ0ZL87_9ACTN|nr:Ig-like domain-containing protein [Nocardioides sp. HM61]WQQ25087.1 Ig-like domain-containing protein [Nocardioides sp. HM61]